MTIRVLVVDDEPLVRSGIALLLSSDPGLQVIGEAADSQAAHLLALRLAPDVVVTDLRMPGADGVELTMLLRESQDGPAVLVLSAFDDDPDVHRALLAGANGYLLKRTAPRGLCDAVHAVAAGQTWLDPGVAGCLVSTLRHSPHAGTAGSAVAQLTSRELEVLVLMAEGLNNAEIAARLWVGSGTVKTHVSRLLHKTGCRDRAQAIALAYSSGLVVVG
ncbi:MAG: DNA-binding response regulator [Actinomycetales bacterium]|nr:MAG: DNA-binding response regulator [Actinomycetales bacterium]